MFPPFHDNDQWLLMYQRMLQLLVEHNSGDFLISAFTSDMQEAWARAMAGWRQSPERYQEIQDEWRQSLQQFNDSIAPDSNPQLAISALKKLHAQLGHCLRLMVNGTPDLSVEDRRLLLFGVRHIVNAMSPEYWPISNEEVIKTFFNTGGASMMTGFSTLQEDIRNSIIGLDVKSAGKDDFKVGETLAITPGEVIYQNSLIQLIQYYPFSQDVYSTPLLIVPPWINKFYVLDLTPTDSFVQWAVRQGYTVFMISWNNPDTDQDYLNLSDYLVKGCMAAIDKTRELTGAARVDLAGYCIGGLLAACTTALMARTGNQSIGTLTLFNTMLDHAESGDIGVFLSRRMLASLVEKSKEDGILDGRILRQMFTMLREDRMFWPYVVNNYFLGRSPKPDPVLYWNHDATNIPLPMLIEIIEDMYHKNSLVTPGDYKLAGEKICLEAIDIPVFVLACKRDHIIPWQSAYKSVFHFSGETSFILSDAGHVMGVLNPPNKTRGGYWEVPGSDFPVDADHWLGAATWSKGSWWDSWHKWNADKQGGQVRARFPGQNDAQIIERAPGAYVMKTII